MSGDNGVANRYLDQVFLKRQTFCYYAAVNAEPLLQPIPRRHLVDIAVLIELADQPRVDQVFYFDVRRFGILRRHEPTDLRGGVYSRRHKNLYPAGLTATGNNAVVDKSQTWHIEIHGETSAKPQRFMFG